MASVMSVQKILITCLKERDVRHVINSLKDLISTHFMREIALIAMISNKNKKNR